MQTNYGNYIIKTNELDQKLSVQITSKSGNVSICEDVTHPLYFPNGICFNLSNSETQPKPKGLKKFTFGDYTFILGINNIGQLHLFHSVKLLVCKKIIDGKDTLTLAFLKDPK